MKTAADFDSAVWGPYASYDDVARFVYGQRLWQHPRSRERLIRHWLDERHPHRERFIERRELIEGVLASTEPLPELDERLRAEDSSLRAAIRDIPPVFGSFY